MDRGSHQAQPLSAGATSTRFAVPLGAVLAALWPLLGACSDAPVHEEQEPLPTPGCRAPAGVSDTPRSIEETLALVNALPKPLTLPCFVEALRRPLQLHATRSQISAQPAVGARSPRVFAYIEPLLMSIAVEGEGAQLLELGEQRADFRSLKGELRFPIEEWLPPSRPFEHVVFSAGLTGCAFCHAAEAREPAISFTPAFVSQALRPSSLQRVPLAGLVAERAACDAVQEPERCALLDALFGWGDTFEWDFPQAMATFGG